MRIKDIEGQIVIFENMIDKDDIAYPPIRAKFRKITNLPQTMKILSHIVDYLDFFYE